MKGFEPADLDPAERRTHLLLTAVQPRALPLGFRDEVMGRIAHRPAAEWIAAAVLALPSLAFLAVQLATQGDELGAALNNVMSAAVAENAEAFFFIDGSTVLALAVLGIASLIAAHASMASPARGTAPR